MTIFLCFLRYCSPQEARIWLLSLRSPVGEIQRGCLSPVGAWPGLLLAFALLALPNRARSQSEAESPEAGQIENKQTETKQIETRKKTGGMHRSVGTHEADVPHVGRSLGRVLSQRDRGGLRAFPDSTAPDRKSPGWALTYSLGSTVLLAPLFGTGLVAGPAAGHFYAGNGGQAWTGIAIRSGAYLTAGIGGVLVWGSIQPTFSGDGPPYDPKPPLGEGAGTAGIVLVSAGVAALLGSATYDIVTTWGAAKSHNQTHAVQAQVAPAVGPRGGQVGLSVRLQF